MGPVGQVALIAVVDPHAAHRSQVAQALISLYRVNEYPDGERALHGLRAAPPSVILVDEVIAPHGAFDFILLLKREPALANIPVIVTSKSPQAAIAEDLKRCGATCFLPKPYRRSTLINTITSQVNKHVEADWDNLPPRERAALKGTVEIFNNISDFIAAGEP
ncbi:MAG: response regulator, partial [Magnetospirillum sp.]